MTYIYFDCSSARASRSTSKMTTHVTASFDAVQSEAVVGREDHGLRRNDFRLKISQPCSCQQFPLNCYEISLCFCPHLDRDSDRESRIHWSDVRSRLFRAATRIWNECVLFWGCKFIHSFFCLLLEYLLCEGSTRSYSTSPRMNTLRLQNNELLTRQRQLEEQLHEQQLQQQRLIERLMQRGLMQSQDEETNSLLQETQSENEMFLRISMSFVANICFFSLFC